MKLRHIFESVDIQELASRVGHKADTQGPPEEISDKRYPIDPETAWHYGVQWALQELEEEYLRARLEKD